MSAGISDLDPLIQALPQVGVESVVQSKVNGSVLVHTNDVPSKSSQGVSCSNLKLQDIRSNSPNRSRPRSPAKPRDELSRKQKVIAVHRVLTGVPFDIKSLRQLAIGKGGYINNELRRRAWPKLLDVSEDDIPSKPDDSVLKAHKYYQQVVLDVNRSLKRFPPGMEDEERLGLQDQLVDTILRVLVRHEELHYYQGYHDIVVTFLLVVGEEITYGLVDKLSTNHLRDFMDSSMDRTNHMLNYLYPIIGRASPMLREYMEKAELGTIFCLPWLITWYGHVLNEFRHVVRLYDFFLASHPLMPIYLASAIVLYREADVLAQECDMAMIHCLLSKIPPDLPLEYLVSRAGDLFVQFPPSELANEARQHYLQSSTISNFEKFAEVAFGQRPEKLHFKEAIIPDKMPVEEVPKTLEKNTTPKTLAKYTLWAVSAGVSAAAVAFMNTALEWEWM